MTALGLLTTIKAGTVGGIVTDPPEQVPDFRSTIRGVARVLRPGGAFVVMGGTREVTKWERLARKANLHFMAELVVLWDSGKPRTRNFGSLHTRIIWYAKGGHRYTFNFETDTRQHIFSNVMVCTRVPIPDRVHPSEKPVGLTNFLISLLTRPGDIVVDPYCGSGSTLVSAVQCDRQYIGSDTDLRSVKISRKRVAMADHEVPDKVYLWVNGKQLEV